MATITIRVVIIIQLSYIEAAVGVCVNYMWARLINSPKCIIQGCWCTALHDLFQRQACHFFQIFQMS